MITKEERVYRDERGRVVRYVLTPPEVPEGTQVAPPRTDLLPLVQQPIPPRRDFILFETQEDIDARRARDLRLAKEHLDRFRKELEEKQRKIDNWSPMII